MTADKPIDACGLSCPQTALPTRQALSSQTNGEVKVMVDSVTARDNVIRTAQKAGWQEKVENRDDGNF